MTSITLMRSNRAGGAARRNEHAREAHTAGQDRCTVLKCCVML